jgi:hypothetical protein
MSELLASALLRWGYIRHYFFDVLAATRPGDFVAGTARYWAAHKQLLKFIKLMTLDR